MVFGFKGGLNFGNLQFGDTKTGAGFDVRAAVNAPFTQARIGLMSSDDVNAGLKFNLGMNIGAGVDAVGYTRARVSDANPMPAFTQGFIQWLQTLGVPLY